MNATFVHGWKAFTVVEAHGGLHLNDIDGGHLHNATSQETELEFDGDEGFKVFDTLKGAWRDTPAIYAHVSCMGDTILHEKGARCSRYSLDYFIEAYHVPELEGIAERLNVEILDPNDDNGCPVCLDNATEDRKAAWFGITYGQ